VVSHLGPPQIRACPIKAPGSSSHDFAAPPEGRAPWTLSAVVALRWDQGSESLASVPPAVSWPGAPFPPRGPSGRFPRFHGTTRRSDSPSPVPPRFVAFAGRYPGCTRVSLPWPPSAPATDLELVTRYLRPGCTEKVKGPPRFLGNPRERALFFDPGGIAGARPLRRCDAAFRCVDDVGSHEDVDFGAQ